MVCIMLVVFLKERRVYDGEIFKLEEHTERLFYSAKEWDIEIPYSQKEINQACKKIVNIQKVQKWICSTSYLERE